MSDNGYQLQRFKNAQADGIYEEALAEIKSGQKTGHWMWFIFPQLDGLGHSPTARFYALKNGDEARAYLFDPVLGARLREICLALLALPDSDPYRIFGDPDFLKLHSSMTLFDTVAPDDIFARVLDKYYGGSRDGLSLALLAEKK